MENPYRVNGLEGGLRCIMWDHYKTYYDKALQSHSHMYLADALTDAAGTYINSNGSVDYISLVYEVYADHFQDSWPKV